MPRAGHIRTSRYRTPGKTHASHELSNPLLKSHQILSGIIGVEAEDMCSRVLKYRCVRAEPLVVRWMCENSHLLWLEYTYGFRAVAKGQYEEH